MLAFAGRIACEHSGEGHRQRKSCCSFRRTSRVVQSGFAMRLAADAGQACQADLRFRRPPSVWMIVGFARIRKKKKKKKKNDHHGKNSRKWPLATWGNRARWVVFQRTCIAPRAREQLAQVAKAGRGRRCVAGHGGRISRWKIVKRRDQGSENFPRSDVVAGGHRGPDCTSTMI